MTNNLNAEFLQFLVLIMNGNGAANIPSLLLCSHRLWRKSTGIWLKNLFIPFSQQNFNTCITNYIAIIAGSCL